MQSQPTRAIAPVLVAMLPWVLVRPIHADSVIVYQNGFESADTCGWVTTEPAVTCDAEMVFVPGGTFTMGASAGSGIPLDEQPPHVVELSAFWIDRTEVTVNAYAVCVADSGCSEPDPNSSLDPYCNWNSNRPGDHPMNCVDWSRGQAYCTWAGKRYPTEAEWEKAARGPDARTYPWGSETPSCDYAVYFDLPLGAAGCGTDHTLPVASKPAGASPYGALDLIGNVWEWISDWYDAGYYAVSPSTDPQGPATTQTNLRVMRGDAWDDSHSTFLRSPNRLYNFPTQWSRAIGFRCARDSSADQRPRP